MLQPPANVIQYDNAVYNTTVGAPGSLQATVQPRPQFPPTPAGIVMISQPWYPGGGGLLRG